MRTCALLLAIAVVVGAPSRARACSFCPVDTRLHATDAAPGGTWWLYLRSSAEVDTLALDVVDDAGRVDAEIVSRGPSRSVAVRVPEGLAPGVELALPDEAEDPFDACRVEAERPNLRVVERDQAPLEPLGMPPLVVEHRETLCGYAPLLAWPVDYACGMAPGIYRDQVCDAADAVLDVPDGLVLDLVVRPEGEDGFAPLTSLNQLVFEAHAPGAIDVMLPPPPDTDGTFVAHARFRRIADGAIGPTASETIEIDPAVSERVGCEGCSAAAASQHGLFASVLVSLSAARRRRRRR